MGKQELYSSMTSSAKMVATRTVSCSASDRGSIRIDGDWCSMRPPVALMTGDAISRGQNDFLNREDDEANT